MTIGFSDIMTGGMLTLVELGFGPKGVIGGTAPVERIGRGPEFDIYA